MTGAFELQMSSADTTSPLQNAAAEIGLLADLIDDNRRIDLVADKLRPVDFAVPLYGDVYARILEISAAGMAPDVVTLEPYFAANEEWPRARNILSAASMNSGPLTRTKTYFDQIRELSARRRMTAGLQHVVASTRDLDVTRDELLAEADQAVAVMAEEATTQQASVGEYAQAVIDSFGKPIVGVRCGMIGSLDDALGVVRPTHLIVVGGRPGMGKTSLVTSYAIGAAARGHGVLIFSMEMSADELTRRMLSDMCCTNKGAVQYEQVRDGTVQGNDLRAVLDAQRRFEQLPLHVNETGGLTLARLIRQARSHKRRLAAKGQKLELIIVDYLQLMGHSRKGMSPYEHASEVSMGLKAFAKTEGLAVMAVAQLSRNVEQRPDKRPVPSDLRDSGQIEQDADAILFVYREEFYLKMQEPEDQFGQKYEEWRTDMEAVRNRIEFIVAKRRSGPTGKASGWFFGANSAVRGADFYKMDGY
ncbi:replicative DNA helicase [Sphingomonas lacusdianchii]|uniref:replicative DNA helicase n=1 Tax=Sphingomonas lacusdianchii TaxID=2917992 RepID=UPI001F576013